MAFNISRTWSQCVFVLWVTFCLIPFSHAEDPQPYVIGASVSMGFNLFGRGHSPSVYTLQKMGYAKQHIIKKTVITGSFRRKYEWLKKSLSEHPASIILAIDVFHHDLREKTSVPDDTYSYIENFLETLHHTGVPVIVGSVWTRYNNEATIDEFNIYLREKVALYDNIYLLPVGQILDGLTKKDRQYSYDVDGVSLSLNKKVGRKLLVDIVHPNNRGARLMSNLIIRILNEDAGMPTPYYEVNDIVELVENMSAK